MPTSPIWREIQMKQETIFLSVAANHFSEMRLMAEGAIALYENQATVLCSMARDADNHEAQIAFNDIGAALYDLRSHMEELQGHFTRQCSWILQKVKRKQLVSLTLSKSQKRG